MALGLPLLRSLQSQSPQQAWNDIFEKAWNVCSASFGDKSPESEIARRDRAVADIDLFLSTAGWDLWRDFIGSTPRCSEALKNWWNQHNNGKAVLVLDALSLREVPWIIQEAEKRGYSIDSAMAKASELPADTTPFAKSLGFSQRSSLANNQAGGAHAFVGARTESVELPWKDCASMIGAEPDWFFWHHWPDNRLHDHDDPGKGLNTLAREVEEHLTSDDFWALVERLSEGRRLVITADHGYAASGMFPDSNKDQTDYLKKVFRSGRWTTEAPRSGEWAPPIDLALNTPHGDHLFVLGRRKWKSAGGYPTLTHGGLSLLEVMVPFIEISRKG